MDYIKEIKDYKPRNEQETQDKKVILDCIRLFPQNILLRENEIAHITCSGFILNKTLNKTLFVHHNIRNVWSWTGGHADGNPNFLAVAAQEAEEETGVSVTPISNKNASVYVLTAAGQYKAGKYVNSHLHLSVSYLFLADEADSLKIKSDENSGVEWFPVSKITAEAFTDRDLYLYTKLLEQAKKWVF